MPIINGEEYLTLKDFSQLVGCSKANITQCIKKQDSRIKFITDEKGRKLILKSSADNWALSRNIYGKTDKNKKTNKSKKSEIQKLDITDNEKIGIIDNNEHHSLSIEDMDINIAKANFLVADATKKQIEIMLLRGKLIERKVVEAVLPSVLIAFKGQIDTIPKNVSSKFAEIIRSRLELEVPTEEITIILREALSSELIKLEKYLSEQTENAINQLRIT
ncbi:hypothetical protein BFL38_14325 [Brachyspira hampsonii]|uniref:Uncharacterized protein n=1 Tax=Brachyspira hampsonii TaxID=1287055 RepID=A0A1E5NH25_9SPIR|nr:hypothetical protein [Brachyspira hampsonii]OEJ15461.1 hypothetical protein BFL38_14325 [Brachyspira hampsonii]